MSVDPPETGAWIRSLGDVFLGLNKSAVIRRVIGVIKIVPTLSVKQVQGLTWQQFIQEYADESALPGLDYAWQALTKDCVAPQYWPDYVPFKAGIVARMHPVENDPIVSVAVHLRSGSEHDFNELMNEHVCQAVQRLVRMGNQVYRGVNGPLTDLQVKEIGSIIANAQKLQQVLEDVQAELLLPATVAPQPQLLATLLDFSEKDFPERRVFTQQLALHSEWTSAVVYCHAILREMVQRLLRALLLGITVESVISLSDQIADEGRAVQVSIRYHTSESDLRVNEPIQPVAVFDRQRFQAARTIERLVMGLHARLAPVNGRAWAEPRNEPDATAVINMLIPRWQGEFEKITSS